MYDVTTWHCDEWQFLHVGSKYGTPGCQGVTFEVGEPPALELL